LRLADVGFLGLDKNSPRKKEEIIKEKKKMRYIFRGRNTANGGVNGQGGDCGKEEVWGGVSE